MMLRRKIRFHSLLLALFFASFSVSAWAQKPGGGGSSSGRSTSTVNRGPITGANLAPNPVSGLALSSPGHIPHAEDEAKIEFRSQTILVQVPAVVTDKSGKHIRGLTKENFQIFENGKEQKVALFEEWIANAAPIIAPQTAPAQFRNVVVNSDNPRLVTVVALDTINTPFLDQAYARKEIVQYFANNLNAGQALGMVLIGSHGLKVVQGLTSDPTALLAALKKVSGEIPLMQNVDADTQIAAVNAGGGTIPSSPQSGSESVEALQSFIRNGDVEYSTFKQENAIEITLRAFLNIAWSLSGVPGRKSLIWATSGFPFLMDSPSALPGGRLSALYERALAALSDANVAVYPVDVRGLVNYAPSVDASTKHPQSGPASMTQFNGRAWLFNSNTDTLKDFAEMTGGQAFYNNNNVSGEIQRATDDSSSYYMLGYYLDTKNDKSGWRQLKVKVARDDVDIRIRRGFMVTNTTMNPELTREADVAYALNSPFESTGIPVMVEWKGSSPAKLKDDKKEVAFVVHVPGSGLTLEGMRNQFDVDFVALANRSASSSAGSDAVGQTVKGNLTPESVERFKVHGIGYSNALELTPGTYAVRFVVRDNFSGRIGSVTAPLTVN